jgi:hypothetical protein
MRACLAAILSLGCLAAMGCNQAKYATLALENENRDLEDRLYQQQAELDRQQRELEQCRRGQEVVRQPGVSADTSSPPPTSAPEKSGAPDTSRPSISVDVPPQPAEELPPMFRDKNTEAPPFSGGKTSPSKTPATPPEKNSLQAPAFPGESPRMEITVPGASRAGTHESVPETLPPTSPLPLQSPATPRESKPDGRLPPGTARTPDNSRVVGISLNDALTGGFQGEPQGGDKGLTLVLEPRDEQGHVVRVPAQVSVVLIDPALEGQAARVARWDFTADQVASLYRKAPWGEGYHLEMLWPDTPPVHSDLRLFVRYVTSDGRKLEMQQGIRLALAGSRGNATAAKPQASPSGGGRAAGWQQKPLSAQPTSATPPEPIRVTARPSPLQSTPPASSSKPAARPTWSPQRP